MKKNNALLIFITGTDGAGKSCLARWLVDHLNTRGLKAVLVWSRFNNFLSKPLLALARLTGHNYYQKIHGTQFGFHDFEHLTGFRFLFALFQMVDVNIAAFRDITRVKKHFDVVVCERGPWDTLVDIMADTGININPNGLMGRLYTAQVRSKGKVILIKRSKENILSTRPELIHDHKLYKKIIAYQYVAEMCGWVEIENNGTLRETQSYLMHALINEMV